MVNPTISTSLLVIRCEMEHSKVKSINTTISDSNPIEMSCDYDQVIVMFRGDNYC